jgi:hypothetical protein
LNTIQVVVDSIELSSPGKSDLLEWEEDALDSFREDNWLGKPTYSVEHYLVSSGYMIDSENTDRLEDMIRESEVMTVFRDIDTDSWHRILHSQEFSGKQREIHQNMGEGSWNMAAYLDQLYDAAPQSIKPEFFFTDTDFRNLRPSFSICQEVEDLIEDSDEFAFQGVEFSAYGESDNVEDSLERFSDDISLNVYFKYSGNQQAVENYNHLTDKRGDSTEYGGVPCILFVGNDSSSYVFIPSGSDVGLSYSEIENRLSYETSGIAAARENIEREKL